MDRLLVTPQVTPLINRLRKAAPTLILLAVGWQQASAQTAPGPAPAPPVNTGAPFGARDPIGIAGRGEDALSIAGKIKGDPKLPPQQVWRLTKGKDFNKLPPDFQWHTPPTPINMPYPVYPFELLKAKVAGKIRAYFIVGPNGRVLKAELDEDTKPEFGLAVRAMLDSCQFIPAKMKDGTPAYANVGIEYNFQPKGRSDAPVAPEARLILQDLEKKPANILDLNDLDGPLITVVRPPPAYPTALPRMKPAGVAEVEFFVDTEGRVQLPHIKTCSAPEFGYAAVQAVAAWRFEAPTKGGKTVVVRVLLRFDFDDQTMADTPKP